MEKSISTITLDKLRRKESHTLERENFDVSLWINNGVYDGCSAFQKVLDGRSNETLTMKLRLWNVLNLFFYLFLVIYAWGVQYDRGCHGKWTDTKKNSWFKRYWQKTVRSITNNVKSKLTWYGNNGQGVFEQCQFDDGFQ